MVIIRPTLCISGCVQGSSELSYRQVAARDYRVPEGIDRHSVSYYSTVEVRVVLWCRISSALKQFYSILE